MATEKETTQTQKSGRAGLKAMLVSAFIIAVPGMYSAWETLNTSAKAKKIALAVERENKTRATQEIDLQLYAKVNKAEISAVKATCVTHQQLLDYMIKIGKEIDRKIIVYNEAIKRNQPYQKRPDTYWQKRYTRLRELIKQARRRHKLKAKRPVLLAPSRARSFSSP